MYVPRIVITSGEPAGVGPDTCVALAQSDWQADLVVAADAELLAAAACALNVPLSLERYDSSQPPTPHRAGLLKVLHVPTARPVVAGRPDARNAAYVIEMLDRACDGCMNGEFAAMVTAPVQKSILMDAGFAFTGHTEYLAARTRAAMPVMMLVSDGLARGAGDDPFAARGGAACDHSRAVARHPAHRPHGPGAGISL